MNQEPQLKPNASFCCVTPNKTEGSSELNKLLSQPAATRKPIKRKYEDTAIASTSYCTLPVKVGL